MERINSPESGATDSDFKVNYIGNPAKPYTGEIWGFMGRVDGYIAGGVVMTGATEYLQLWIEDRQDRRIFDAEPPIGALARLTDGDLIRTELLLRIRDIIARDEHAPGSSQAELPI